MRWRAAHPAGKRASKDAAVEAAVVRLKGCVRTRPLSVNLAESISLSHELMQSLAPLASIDRTRFRPTPAPTHRGGGGVCSDWRPSRQRLGCGSAPRRAQREGGVIRGAKDVDVVRGDLESLERVAGVAVLFTTTSDRRGIPQHATVNRSAARKWRARCDRDPAWPTGCRPRTRRCSDLRRFACRAAEWTFSASKSSFAR